MIDGRDFRATFALPPGLPPLPSSLILLTPYIASFSFSIIGKLVQDAILIFDPLLYDLHTYYLQSDLSCDFFHSNYILLTAAYKLIVRMEAIFHIFQHYMYVR